ncbi:MAG: hypothetical protein BKP49_02480 [Treponema sp. CETP13]|nr:MAG: hypothetical protein BKP49_02480 [Treponema sp. CETP13]
MNTDIQSYSALMSLNRTTTNTLNDIWPDEPLEKSWKEFIKYLDSFNNKYDIIENISEKKIFDLQKLLKTFFENPKSNINIFTKQNLIKIIANIHRIKINNSPFDSEKNEKKLLVFFDSINKHDYSTIAVPIMRYYLSYEDPKKFIQQLVFKVFSTLKKKDPFYISDLQLYTNRKYTEGKINSVKAETLYAVLQKIGISSTYIYTRYFNSFFLSWFLSLNNFTLEFLKANKKLIDNSTNDEKIIFFAHVIIKSYANNFSLKNDDFIRTIDKEIFPTPNKDKTEKTFWNLADSKYKTIKYNEMMNSAHKYYQSIFNRFIITQFYDSLTQVAGDKRGKERAEFWRKYGNSKQMSDIKFVVNSIQKNIIFEDLTEEYKTIFLKHCINNKSTSKYEAPIFIIIFYTKILVDYFQTGHSGQVFNSDNKKIKSLLVKKSIENTKTLNIYREGSVFNNLSGEGRITHIGRWRRNTIRLLSYNNIFPGSKK